MNSREKVRAALRHKTGGGIPFDIGSTPVTGIHVTCVAALRDYYGLEKRPVKIHEPYQMLGLPDEDLLEVLGVDVEEVASPYTFFGFPNENWKPWRTDEGLEVLVSEHLRTTLDANGDHLMYPAGDTSAPPSAKMPKNGFYFDAIIRQDPIDEERLDPSDNLEEFGPVTDEVLAWYQSEVARAAATGRAVAANFGGTALGDVSLVPGVSLKHPKGIRDIAEWYISTLTRRDYIHQVFEKQTEIALANLKKIHAVVGDQVDVVFICGTDFGTQTSSFCSVEDLRELYFPYYKRINDWIHRHTHWKTFKHSCGSVEKFIETFIEAGFDILNPVQCSATGMDPEHLKTQYGDRLVFWGGGIDTQKVLPFGTPAEVREQVLRRCEIFGKNGGFVFSTIHNIQANTPVENIVSLVETFKSVSQ